MKLHTICVVIAVVTFSFGSLGWCDELSDYQAIEAAVKAGKLTKEEAAAKLAYLKKAATAKSPKTASPKSGKLTDYQAIALELSKLVKAGHLSEEQATAMLAAARQNAPVKSE